MMSWLKKHSIILIALIFLVVLIPHTASSANPFSAAYGAVKAIASPQETILSGLTAIIIFVGNLILGLFALILVVVGWVFDLSIYLSILNIKDFFAIEAISKAWAMARDSVNVLFIFMLLWFAFQKVAGLAKVDITKSVINLIMIAVLINFSGVIVRIVVDTTNIVAVQFYKQITTSSSGNGVVFRGVAQKLRNGLDLKRITAVQQADAGKDISDPDTSAPSGATTLFGSIAAIFWGVIMIIVTAFVLLMASILFIIRTIYLVFLYVVSPIAIGIQLLPVGKTFFDGWKRDLTNQAIFAPVFLFFIMLTLNIIESGGVGSVLRTTGEKAFGTNALYAGIVMSSVTFMILIGLMLLSIMMAKKLGAAGSDLAIKGATKGTAQLTSLAAGTGARLTRGAGRGLGATGRKLGKATAGRWAPGLSTKVYQGASKWGKAAKSGVQTGLQFAGQQKAITQATGINALAGTGITKAITQLTAASKDFENPLAGLGGKKALEAKLITDADKAYQAQLKVTKAAFSDPGKQNGDANYKKYTDLNLKEKDPKQTMSAEDKKFLSDFRNDSQAKKELDKLASTARSASGVLEQSAAGANNKDVGKTLMDPTFIENMSGKMITNVLKNSKLDGGEANKILTRIEMGMNKQVDATKALNTIYAKSMNRKEPSADDKRDKKIKELEEKLGQVSDGSSNQPVSDNKGG